MKKITLLVFSLFSILAFSQDNKLKIQDYLNQNKEKFDLTTQDIADWFIESDGNSESTGINNYYIKQRYQGIEVYNAVSNVWVKNDQVINVMNRFYPNLAQKTNTTTPTLQVLQALEKAFQHVQNPLNNNEIVGQKATYEYSISNGNLTEDPIKAELIFQPVANNNLKLAWQFTFYTQNHKNLWEIAVDAVNGAIIGKHDLVISCNFDSKCGHSVHEQKLNFSTALFNAKSAFTPLQVQGGSYRVIPYNYESPNHTTRQLISNPENATASPKGWHNTNTLAGTNASLIYSYLRGNNTWTRADYSNTDPTTHSTNSTANGYSPTNAGLIFDYSYPGTTVAPQTYIDAAATNLFYMNNMLHDIWYHYGFNEANGNFQQTNYTPVSAPASADAVWADAQDGSTLGTPSTNNANFSTPVDGSKPRMQMYIWNYGPKSLFVLSPSSIAGEYYSVENGFNPGNVPVPLAPGLIQSELVLYLDTDPSTSIACTPASNAAQISGKIAVIRRVDCTFVTKVLNAQAAGAIAVIIVNNVPNQLVTMSGADASITIPAVFVTQEDGEAMIAEMQSGPVVVKLQRQPFVNTDGDLDNGIIGHEFGHGISTRLAGGRANSSCLLNYDQMGEGWSDWFAMMLQIKPGDVGATPKGLATFVLSEPTDGAGLRSYPYTTNMAINPLTYVNSNSEIPADFADTSYRYVNGDFWATVLWDLAWAYIDKYGYDDNKHTGTGGNNKVMRLVLDGLKLQPCSPTVVSARDALFAADQATTGGQDYCMIAEVFRRRGVGLNASAGSNNDCNDQVEDFTAFPNGPNCTLAVNYFEHDELFRIYPNPTNGLLNIRINGYVGKTNIDVVDVNGRLVKSFKNANFNTEATIDLSSLQTGVYVVKVVADNVNYTQKVVIK
jgi:extracellular elastinolytic metalloproteinase